MEPIRSRTRTRTLTLKWSQSEAYPEPVASPLLVAPDFIIGTLTLASNTNLHPSRDANPILHSSHDANPILHSRADWFMMRTLSYTLELTGTEAVVL